MKDVQVRNISDVRHCAVGRSLVSRRSDARRPVNDSAKKLHKSRLMRCENRLFLRLTFIFTESFDGGTRGPALPDLNNFLCHISLIRVFSLNARICGIDIDCLI